MGDTEQLHCYELLSKITLRPCSGQPKYLRAPLPQGLGKGGSHMIH